MAEQNTPATQASATPSETSQELESQVSEDTASEEGEEQSADGTSEAASPAADMSKKEQKQLVKQLKKFKLKVDGKDYEEELDLNDDAAVTKHLQMSRASQKRMQEATELRKAAEDFIEMLRTNPRKVLADPNINVDLKKFVQEYIDEEISNASKSPEQIEKEKLQKELEDIKSKYEKEEKDRKEREFTRLQAEQEEKIQTDIESALTTGSLPKTPYTVRKMAEMMMIALQNNIDLSPKDIVPLLKKQMNNDIKDLFSASSDDVFEELLGKDNLTRVRKRNLQKVKNKQIETANSVKATGQKVEKQESQEKKMTIKEFLKA